MAKSTEPEHDTPGHTPGEPVPDPSFPDENPNRPREYHGRRTMLVALGVMGAVALAIWLATGGGGSASIAGDFGLVELPSYLNLDREPVGAQVQSLAPDFELETLDGDRFRLSDLRGHPVVLNLWASWCEPCRLEVPVLVRLQEQYREHGILGVGMNVEEARGPARGFVEEFGIDYALPMDFSGGVARTYLQVGLPNTYFIDADGAIVEIFRGQAPDTEFERAFAALASTLTDPVGPAILPGPKALPTSLVPDDIAVGTDPGSLAPDFVARGQDRNLWRLSDQRGQALLLAFVPHACTECSLPAELVSDAAVRSVATVQLREQPAGDEAIDLAWESATASLYGVTTEIRYALVDAIGVIVVIDNAITSVRVALSRLPAPVAAGASSS